MEVNTDNWAFIVALTAVVNGLGIVRLLGSFGEYLKSHSAFNIKHYWVYTLLAVFQLLAHVLLWWSILGLRSAGNINFLMYLYLLVGPTLLYLGTVVMIPEPEGKSLDLRHEYYGFRKMYYCIMAGFWLWAIFVWPVFGYAFPPTVPLGLGWLSIAVILLITDNPKIHGGLVLANCVVYACFVAIFAMQLGGVGRGMVE